MIWSHNGQPTEAETPAQLSRTKRGQPAASSQQPAASSQQPAARKSMDGYYISAFDTAFHLHGITHHSGAFYYWCTKR
jgi:hypothetical protein